MKIIRFIKYLIFILFLIVVISEIMVRSLPSFIDYPEKSLYVLSRRLPYSNLRTYPELNELVSAKILLPEKEKKEILVLGDSFPFGTYIQSDETFPSVIQKITGKKVVNLAVGAQGPLQYNRMLEIGMQYDPDIILYCIFANDFFHFHSVEIKKLSLENTYIRYDSDYELFIDRMNWKHKLARMIKSVSNHFMGFQLVKLSILYNRLDVNDIKTKIVCYDVKGNSFCSKELFWDDFLSWDKENVKRGVQINTDLVKEAYDFATRHDKDFFVVLIPSKEMVYGPFAKEKDLIYNDSHARTFFEFESRLKKLNILVLNTKDYLSNKARKGLKLYFTFDGHFNESGHQELANAICQYMQFRNR